MGLDLLFHSKMSDKPHEKIYHLEVDCCLRSVVIMENQSQNTYDTQTAVVAEVCALLKTQQCIIDNLFLSN